MRSNYYQSALIILSIIVSTLLGAFIYRELFPEYKVYQKAYVALEEFHSTYTGEPVAEFKFGIKQIFIPSEDNGPPIVDRCISCHVALDLPDFSPTKVLKDINGQVVRDEKGFPQLVTNDNYVFRRLDEKIKELENEQNNRRLLEAGKQDVVDQRLAQAEELKKLKTVQVGEYVYDLSKVLVMHPLIGKETRPFELHPVEEMGCVVCHNGNGRGLVTDRAHGPVRDGQYEAEHEGSRPQFIESDPIHDPEFSKLYNHKPNDRLLFQVNPLFVGSVVEAKCVQCHRTETTSLNGKEKSLDQSLTAEKQTIDFLKQLLNEDIDGLIAYETLKRSLNTAGFEKTIAIWKEKLRDVRLPTEELNKIAAQLQFLEDMQAYGSKDLKTTTLAQIQKNMVSLLGSKDLLKDWEKQFNQEAKEDFSKRKRNLLALLKTGYEKKGISGQIFQKANTIAARKHALQDIETSQHTLKELVFNHKLKKALGSELDASLKHYQRGKELFISQACYACHKIAGFSRGGIGPELTKEGLSYPWFVKESIVWPQADLASSTMPNFKLDHDEIEDLMTYLMAQTGKGKAISEVDYAISLKAWDAGAKLPWEKSIPLGKLKDVQYAMKIFASEGCASCHRLQGFSSSVGFAAEKSGHWEEIFADKDWFEQTFPENIQGSQIINNLVQHADVIDRKLLKGVHDKGILEEIEEERPGLIQSFYQPFEFALRGKPEKVNGAPISDSVWKDRLNRVFKTYIKEYGLGRLIGPRLSWSGVYRTDEWLMEHFRKPDSHVPGSLMPVMPFDETKFLALTHMLDVLGQNNRKAIRQRWQVQGFNPAKAFEIHCAICHGESLHGDGPVSQWIYPIPKNLRNPTFLRNLSADQAVYSITHGVRGTPMPPWGEVASEKTVENSEPVITPLEIKQLVEWLFDDLPGDEFLPSQKQIPKWDYTPEDAVKELEKEGNQLQKKNPISASAQKTSDPLRDDLNAMYAAIEPKVHVKDNQQRLTVDHIFDVVPNPGGKEPYRYMIKRELYTQENLKRGEAFFAVNCAHCHGREGGGNGDRAESMDDAKPRMLTNVDWLNSHDDLRLLRSIKYGVPGTAMTQWGDATTSLQRLQLVMYIRSLSEEKTLRNQLLSLVYQAIDQSIVKVEQLRADEATISESLNDEISVLRQERINLESSHNLVAESKEKALTIFRAQLELESKLNTILSRDKQSADLKNSLVQEKKDLELVVDTLISRGASSQIIDLYIQFLRMLPHRFEINGSSIQWSWTDDKDDQLKLLINQMRKDLDDDVQALHEKKLIAEGKLPSAEKLQELKSISDRENNLEKLRLTLFGTLENVLQMHCEQKLIVEERSTKM